MPDNVDSNFVQGKSCILESPTQFENRIMARVYVRSFTRSMLHFVNQNLRMKNKICIDQFWPQTDQRSDEST